MSEPHTHRKSERSPEEKARIKGLRDSFQKERPSQGALVQSGEYLGPVSMGEFLDTQAVAHALKEARLRAKLSLADVAAKTGMDRATISRLENGMYPNTTINTINRLAHAYGKRFTFRMEDEPEPAW